MAIPVSADLTVENRSRQYGDVRLGIVDTLFLIFHHIRRESERGWLQLSRRCAVAIAARLVIDLDP